MLHSLIIYNSGVSNHKINYSRYILSQVQSLVRAIKNKIRKISKFYTIAVAIFWKLVKYIILTMENVYCSSAKRLAIMFS